MCADPSIGATRGLQMHVRTKKPTETGKRDICNGPGKLTQALGIDLTQNGSDLTREPLFVLKGQPITDDQVRVSPRIGLVHATEWPLRFFLINNEHVSRHKFNRDATAYSEQTQV